MKKILIGLLIALILIGYAAYDFTKKAPTQLYAKALKGEIHSKWYSSQDLTHLITPETLELKNLELQSPNWWNRMRIGDFKFPIPYQHPLYRVKPIFPKKDSDKIGLAFSDNQKNEMIRLYFRESSYFLLQTPGEKFYKVPFVNYIVTRYSVDEVWKNLFKRKVPLSLEGLRQGIKDLYLLEQRLIYLPKEFTRFGQLVDREEIKFITIDGDDKDYHYERFLINRDGNVFSFDLLTLRNNQSAEVFRDHLIRNFELAPSTTEIRDITYSGFQRLDREMKQDEVGFIHLYSAWSQDIKKKSLVQEMIYYAEMNPDLNPVLARLYDYSLLKYGKLYSHHRDIFLKLDDKLSLQRKIELEEKRLRKSSLSPEDYIPPVESDRSQTLKEKLRRARQMKDTSEGYRVN